MPPLFKGTILSAAAMLVAIACSDEDAGPGADTGGADEGGEIDISPDITADTSADADAEADLAADAVADFEPDVPPDTEPDSTQDVSDSGADGEIDAEPEAPPSDYVMVTFAIDDRANGTYTADDGLAWKGTFSYDAVSNVATYDSASSGPFILLYDDGPATESGHEAEGSVAEDHIWSVAVLFEIPEAEQTYEYSAIRGSVAGSDGESIWSGANGTFTLFPSTEPGSAVAVSGLTLPALGWIDLRFSLDGTAIDAGFSGSPPAAVQVKSDAWGWTLLDLAEAGDTDQWSLVLSEGFSGNADLRHRGLMYPDEEPEFVFVLDGANYEVSTVPAIEGVTVEHDRWGSWVELPVANRDSGDQNAFVTVPYAPPAEHVAINFCIDDTANQSYSDADGLAWKGSFSYDATRRSIAFNGGWTGPYVLVYDDGPWTDGGHEPGDAAAGDHIWCAAAFAPIPDSDENYAYGAIRGSLAGSDGQWIWIGANGGFGVPSTALEGSEIDVGGLTIPPWGDWDLRFSISEADLADGFGSPTAVNVKSSAWGWDELSLAEDTPSAGQWQLIMSEHVGLGTDLPNAGLLNPDDVAEFVFVIDGDVYKGAVAYSDGVTVEVSDTSAETPTWTASPIDVMDSEVDVLPGGLDESNNGNTYVVVPSGP